MKQILIAFSALILLAACKSPEQKTTASEPSFPLKAYVETEDKAFRYEIVETIKGDSWTEYRIYMVSGTWFTHEEVDEPEWWHWLTMVVPDDVQEISYDILRHRIILSYEAQAEEIDTDKIIEMILSKVDTP